MNATDWNVKRGRVLPGDVAGNDHSAGYLEICIGQGKFLAHRVAWFIVHREWPIEIDHRDLNRKNNRIDNLRNASRSDNQGNVPRRTNNKSGFKGVVLRPSGRWSASITRHRKQRVIGVFDTPEEAHAAYVAQAAQTFQDFSRG